MESDRITTAMRPILTMATKRQLAIDRMRVAGYHSDQRERVRLLVESRVNRQIMDEAFGDGERARKSGVRCSCFECATVGSQATVGEENQP